MQLGLKIRAFFDNLTMPKDGLATQARDVMTANDVNGNGYVDLENPNEGVALGPLGMAFDARRGFEFADRNGNGDGHTSVKEIRTLLQRYDGDRNATIEGFEFLALLRDFVRPGNPVVDQARAGQATLR